MPQRLQRAQCCCIVRRVSVSFAELMRVIVDGYGGSKKAFAREADISPSALSRLLKGGRPPAPEVCLQIAKVGGVSPSIVLRAAGHEETAALLESLYGPARPGAPSEYTAAERSLLLLIRQLDPPARKAFAGLIGFYLGERTARRRRSRSRRRRSSVEKQTA
jgi:transcriptional regulator with XRE-family HTH domain